jgi:DNA-binding SARP family transcriptional activator/predicted ATPase
MTRLAIRVLGPFEVSLDGEPVTHFETLKTRALLAYLATRSDQPHRREFLSEMLWPDRPQGATRANLRHTLRSLRLAIGDYEAQTPFLRVTRETIQLSPDGDSWVDVRAFAESLAGLQGIGCPEPGQLERAIGLVRGAFLEGVSLADSAVFEEWAALKREQVRRNALNVLARLAEHHEQRGEYEQALPHAWRQVDLEPWDETAHQQVMRLLARSGHRAQALAQYETLCRLLADELGAEPMAETRMLFAAICSGELGLEPALRSGPPVPVWNLPASPTPFFGRRDELSILEERLADPHARPLTLTGPGGSGKTRLALEAGTRLAEGDCRALADGSPLAFPHGAVFVPLAAVDAVEALVPALADALPLALELAASWADALSLTDILAETQRSLDFLQAEVPDLPARQRSMRVVFDTAWQRLSAAERALFTQLSVLRGGYTRESAKLVAGGREPTLHLLASLVRKSFVQVDQTRDRYHLHVLLRQYGAAKLAQEPAREAEACDRHSRHLCGWLGPRGGDLRGGRQKAALAEIGIGLENVRAACVWAAAHGRADRINQASYPLGLFYCLQGTLEAGDITLRTLAERLSTGVGPMSGTQVSVQWAMARLCLWRSVFASHMGDRLQSTRSAHEALDSWTRPSLLTRIRASNERSSGRHWATPCATPIRQRPGCASAGRTSCTRRSATGRAWPMLWRAWAGQPATSVT